MSRRLPALKPKQVIRTLERAGFFLHHVRGSHHIFKHPQDPTMRITVPLHSRDLAPKTLRSIIKQAGFTVEEFLQLL